MFKKYLVNVLNSKEQLKRELVKQKINPKNSPQSHIGRQRSGHNRKKIERL